jgi:septal ring factor EnvC (AmiA/AmiB activator)
MKITGVLLGVLLLAGMAFLAARQHRLQTRISGLEKENKILAETVAQKPDLSPELIAQTEARLESTRAALAATERRLTNVVAQVTDIERQLPVRSVLTQSTTRDAFGDVPAFNPGLARPAASSHAPDGRLLDRS